VNIFVRNMSTLENIYTIWKGIGLELDIEQFPLLGGEPEKFLKLLLEQHPEVLPIFLKYRAYLTNKESFGRSQGLLRLKLEAEPVAGLSLLLPLKGAPFYTETVPFEMLPLPFDLALLHLAGKDIDVETTKDLATLAWSKLAYSVPFETIKEALSQLPPDLLSDLSLLVDVFNDISKSLYGREISPPVTLTVKNIGNAAVIVLGGKIVNPETGIVTEVPTVEALYRLRKFAKLLSTYVPNKFTIIYIPEVFLYIVPSQEPEKTHILVGFSPDAIDRGVNVFPIEAIIISKQPASKHIEAIKQALLQFPNIFSKENITDMIILLEDWTKQSSSEIDYVASSASELLKRLREIREHGLPKEEIEILREILKGVSEIEDSGAMRE